jgi:hypothetical protein
VGPELAWSTWVQLETAALSPTIPRQAGVYRLRSDHDVILDYVGQTGSGSMDLRRRLAMLSGVFREDMPYRDPHTAAPALWAWRRCGRTTFEASVAVVPGSTARRKGLECLAISQHRWTNGCSPRWNFGRMPPGYRMSSANNRRLVEAGRRFRGGPTHSIDLSHAAGIAPLARPGDDPADLAWGGLDWSPWVPINELAGRRLGVGLYRIGADPGAELAYVGEGDISGRLASHLLKASRPDHRQAAMFADPNLRCSWVTGAWANHQRLEIETDLIANHLQRHGTPPPAQFLG